MVPTDIPLDKAELLSVLLESLLYGFSLLMFGGTIWTLSSQRSAQAVNSKMLIVACLLLLFSTAHLVIDIIRVMEGLVLFRDTYPGGPVGYFSDVSRWTFFSKNYVYLAQTLIGDGVVLYRCYAVWQSKLVMILPMLLYCSVTITGLLSSYTASTVTYGVFNGSLSLWIVSFWAAALATNLLTTLMLVIRVWHLDQQAKRLRWHRKSSLRPILRILAETGTIYSLTLIVALTCFVSRTNGQYVVLAMVTPIISITFYMVIIRVGLPARTTRRTASIPTSRDHGSARRQKMQVRITTLTQSIVDDANHSMVSLTQPMNGVNHSRDMFDGVGEAL